MLSKPMRVYIFTQQSQSGLTMESWDKIIGIVTVGWKFVKPLFDSW